MQATRSLAMQCCLSLGSHLHPAYAHLSPCAPALAKHTAAHAITHAHLCAHARSRRMNASLVQRVFHVRGPEDIQKVVRLARANGVRVSSRGTQVCSCMHAGPMPLCGEVCQSCVHTCMRNDTCGRLYMFCSVYTYVFVCVCI